MGPEKAALFGIKRFEHFHTQTEAALECKQATFAAK